MKKLLISFLVLFSLLLVVAVVAPFVIDVNHYRSIVETKVNEQINGKLSLGKINLSLWGTIKFKVDGLRLTDQQNMSLVEVKDAEVQLPVTSLLLGSPVLKLVLDHPSISVVKGRDGKINLLGLMKPKAAEATASGSGQAPQAGSAKAEGGSTELPPLVLRSKLTFLIEHAKVNYKDEVAASNYNISDFSFHLKDVSPSSKIPFDAEAKFDLTMGKSMKVTGPLRLDGEMKATGPSANLFSKIDGKLALIFDDLDIEDSPTFHKKKGVPLRFDMTFIMSENAVDVPKVTFRIAEVSIDGKASTKTMAGVTAVEGQLQSNRIDVAKLGALVPSISENGLNGVIELAAQASGPSDHLNYSAKVKFNEVKLKTESLAQTVALNGAIEVATNELKNLDVKFLSNGLDGSLSGSLVGFAKPVFRFALNAKEIDMDKLFPKKAGTEKSKSDSEPAASSQGDVSKGATGAGDENYNAMLNPLRQNPLIAQAAGTFDFNIQTLKSSKVVVKNLKGQLALNQLLMQLKAMSFHVFDGNFKADASINAKNSVPEVGMNLEIDGLNTQRMVESQMSFAKNTVKGIVFSKMNIGGRGLNRPEINSNWKGGGQFTLKDATFSSLDVGRQIKSGLIEKLPEFIKAKVHVSDNLLNWRGEYASLVAKFNLQNGVLNMADLDGKAIPQKGMDLKGTGHVSIVDYSTDMVCDFIDRYTLLGPNMPKDKRYGAGAITAHITGSLFAPKFDWGRTVEQLAKSAASDTLKEKGKDAVKKQLENVKVPEAAKNLLKGLFH